MKKIVFDMAAVLLSWQPRELLMRTLAHRATDAVSAAHWEAQIFEGYQGDWAEFDRGTVAVPELVQRISRRTGLDDAEVRAVVDAVPHELQAIPETVDLLHQLGDAGHELYYLSNMPAPYADVVEAANPFFGRFRAGVFSGRVRHIKPEPGIFALAAERFDAAAHELVFLDDTAANVVAARSLGWNALQFSHAEQARAELRARGWAEA